MRSRDNRSGTPEDYRLANTYASTVPRVAKAATLKHEPQLFDA